LVTILLGVSGVGDNGYNYTTLSYSSGPGFWNNVNNQTTDPSKPWLDASTLDIHNKTYRQLSQIPADDAFHGGEDVAVYATGTDFFSQLIANLMIFQLPFLLGPMSHLFHGVHEQSYVAHVVGHAACMGPYSTACEIPKPEAQSGGIATTISHVLTLLMALTSTMILKY
jgi:alkaline phosphatase